MQAVLANVASVFRHHERELVCARCLEPVASVRLRPLRPPRLRHVNGTEIAPMSHGLAAGVLRTRLDDARKLAEDQLFGMDEELPSAIQYYQSQLDYLDRQAGESIYELLCVGCGTGYLRSVPHLSWIARHALTRQVALH